MPVGGAHLVGTAIVVVGELQLGLIAREAEEVVRRFELPVATPSETQCRELRGDQGDDARGIDSDRDQEDDQLALSTERY